MARCFLQEPDFLLFSVLTGETLLLKWTHLPGNRLILAYCTLLVLQVVLLCHGSWTEILVIDIIMIYNVCYDLCVEYIDFIYFFIFYIYFAQSSHKVLVGFFFFFFFSFEMGNQLQKDNLSNKYPLSWMQKDYFLPRTSLLQQLKKYK